ncbi:SDR family oxidoreductase [Sorangium sp. So ce1036]|uniref:SDR family oxidoreductase n=1 Tax=Sorangium sp. So ce1036 TaxID=3133328 RepID=UPI003F0B8804
MPQTTEFHGTAYPPSEAGASSLAGDEDDDAPTSPGTVGASLSSSAPAPRVEPRPLRILVTGAGGQLGGRLRHRLSKHATVIPIGRSDRGAVRACDIRDPQQVEGLFAALKPDVCIHAAAIADPDQCERDPVDAYATNVAGTDHIADACERHRSRLVFISTDYVFSGREHAYTETDVPGPLQIYGWSKLTAERRVTAVAASIVLRLPLVYGPPRAPDGGFVRTVEQSLRRGRVITACDRRQRYPVLADDVADIVWKLLAAPRASGVYHVSGPEAITRLGWARLIAEIAGHDADALVRPAPEDGAEEKGAPRPSPLKLEDARLRQTIDLQLTSLRHGTAQVLQADNATNC